MAPGAAWGQAGKDGGVAEGARGGAEFWRGVLFGLVLAAAGLIALALAYPPVPAEPPALAPGALSAPAAPAEPDAPAGAQITSTEAVRPLGPVAPGPLLEGGAPEAPPAVARQQQPAAPEPGPSPSLVPGTAGAP
jgi:hypothetical protein